MVKLPHRRQFLHLAAGAAALPALSRIARAQAYPTRPVRLIVPYAPAGGTDILARIIGQRLSERIGQQFIIENRSGANSNIGTETVVRAPPDGHTLLFVDIVMGQPPKVSAPWRVQQILRCLMEMPADGMLAARCNDRDFGTSRRQLR